MPLVPAPPPRTPPARILVHDVRPSVEGGRWPAKRTVGDVVVVECDLVRDGHEALRAALRHRAPGARAFAEEPMMQLTPDRWRGEFTTTELGIHRFQVEAWVDPFASWRDELERKLAAGQEDLEGELAEGAALLEAAAGRLKAADRRVAQRALAALAAGNGVAERADAALALDVADALSRNPERRDRARSETLEIDVDRERARVGAWYELFPRSFGGFAGVQLQLPRLAELGFDVIYLPPIHPIGRTHRKGRNNALDRRRRATRAAPGRSAAPRAATPRSTPSWARSRTSRGWSSAARDHGHRDRARLRDPVLARPPLGDASTPSGSASGPTGRIKYAENPPKKYQDIYPSTSTARDWRGLWDALRDVVLFWVEQGVRIFRVDNPHTKPLAFWEWLIARRARGRTPTSIFLSEAFTRPARCSALAKVGFSQSYTYFTWRTQGGADRVLHRADGHRVARVLPAELLRQHARTSSTSSSSRAAGRRSRRALVLAATLVAELRHLLAASSSASARRSRPAARSTWTPRSTRPGSAASTGPCSRC